LGRGSAAPQRNWDFIKQQTSKDRGFNKTRNLIFESAAEPRFQKLKIWF
jgi:hypothetical protein